MIRSIELVDFLAHSNTKLELENDATVFVGDNGAGKSSIIDAITFSLFGKHTRKNNKGLIRRGANQGFAKIEFSANGKNYQTIRKIDSKGTLTAQFAEDVNGKLIPIAEGERKQFGESMTKHVEETLGMDFEKLKIASIVQQGELNSIIKAKPKEFKELLNTIIGIDKLDTALASMRTVQREFRSTIQKKFGYDDIQVVENKIAEYQNESKKAQPRLEYLDVEKKEQELLISKLEKQIQSDSTKESQLKDLESRKKEWQEYAKDQEAFFSDIVVELLYTMDQSGSEEVSDSTYGWDDYYNNYLYRGGWVYKRKVIGNPMFTLGKNEIRDWSHIVNNRIIAIHTGFEGNITSSFQYRALFTY